MDKDLRKLWKIVKDRGAWHAAVHEIVKSQTWVRDWKTATMDHLNMHNHKVMFEERNMKTKRIVFPILFKNVSLNPCWFSHNLPGSGLRSMPLVFSSTMGETKAWLEILSFLSQLGKKFPELGMLPASHKPTFQAVGLITMDLFFLR